MLDIDTAQEDKHTDTDSPVVEVDTDILCHLQRILIKRFRNVNYLHC